MEPFGCTIDEYEPMLHGILTLSGTNILEWKEATQPDNGDWVDINLFFDTTFNGQTSQTGPNAGVLDILKFRYDWQDDLTRKAGW